MNDADAVRRGALTSEDLAKAVDLDRRWHGLVAFWQTGGTSPSPDDFVDQAAEALDVDPRGLEQAVEDVLEAEDSLTDAAVSLVKAWRAGFVI
jgi:hypothetical protein